MQTTHSLTPDQLKRAQAIDVSDTTTPVHTLMIDGKPRKFRVRTNFLSVRVTVFMAKHEDAISDIAAQAKGRSDGSDMGDVRAKLFAAFFTDEETTRETMNAVYEDAPEINWFDDADPDQLERAVYNFLLRLVNYFDK